MTTSDGSASGATAVATAHSSGSGPEKTHGFHVFSAPSDAPRVRWKTDLISAGFTATMTLVLILVAGQRSDVDETALDWVGALPGWLLWLAQAAYVVGVLYGLGLLIGVGLFAKGRWEVLRDMLLAAVFAVVIALVLTAFVDERWPEFAFFDLDKTRYTFPAIIVTTAAATQAAASSAHRPVCRQGTVWLLVSRTLASKWTA